MTTVPKDTEAKREHVKRMQSFIEHICQYGEDPSAWPLTHDEQIRFVRSVIFQARWIKASEGYVTVALEIATEELAMQS